MIVLQYTRRNSQGGTAAGLLGGVPCGVVHAVPGVEAEGAGREAVAVERVDGGAVVVGEHAGPGEVVGAGREVRRDGALGDAELHGGGRLGALRPEEEVVVPERRRQRVWLRRRGGGARLAEDGGSDERARRRDVEARACMAAIAHIAMFVVGSLRSVCAYRHACGLRHRSREVETVSEDFPFSNPPDSERLLLLTNVLVTLPFLF